MSLHSMLGINRVKQVESCVTYTLGVVVCDEDISNRTIYPAYNRMVSSYIVGRRDSVTHLGYLNSPARLCFHSGMRSAVQ